MTLFDPKISAERSLHARERIRGHVLTTPLVESTTIGPVSGSTLLFKAENFQLTNSFKVRGAFAKLTKLAQDGDEAGLITASSGNHGIATGLAAARLGRELAVVLPLKVSPAKLKRIRSFGVEIVLHGEDSGLAESHAQHLSKKRGLTYVSPYNDMEVVAGQGTIALELLDQHPRIDNVFIAMGGGGLIGGIGAVLKAYSPHTRIIGCAATNSMALAAAMVAGKSVDVDHLPTLADGVAGALDDRPITLPLALGVIDAVVTCEEDEIASALARIALDEHLLVEGAAGLALAGFLKLASQVRNQVNVVIICGANFEHDELISVIERARVQENISQKHLSYAG